MDGWICLHRKITEWEWYDDANTLRLFIHLLLMANHKPNKWRGKTIQRGQFVSSRAILATSLKLSEQQIRTALDKLISTGEITKQGSAQHTVFTVVNYEKHQTGNQLNNQQTTSEATNKQPTSNQQSNREITTNNNDNNTNKEEICAAEEQKPAAPNGKNHHRTLQDQIAEIYNEVLGDALPRVEVLSDARRKVLKARCSKKLGSKQTDDPEFWRGYFGYIANDCPFLVGENKDGWTANFDWIISEKNFIKIIEGTYTRQEQQH